MKFHSLKLGSRELKLRLDSANAVQLEKTIGRNPLDLIMDIQVSGKLPKLDDLIKVIVHSSQALEHGITTNDIYRLYDEFVEGGHDYSELIPEIVEVFVVSGFLKIGQNKDPLATPSTIEK